MKLKKAPFAVGEKVVVIDADGAKQSNIGDVLKITEVQRYKHDWLLRFVGVNYGLYASRLARLNPQPRDYSKLQKSFTTPEGVECRDPKCTGTLEFPPVENCSCHINPPCSACTLVELECTVCGMTEKEWSGIDPNNDMLTEDEDEAKRKEFDAVMRERSTKRHLHPEQLTEILEEEGRAKQLANAIEKTLSGAAHPQAMWRRQ